MENLFDELNRLYSDVHKKQASEQQTKKENTLRQKNSDEIFNITSYLIEDAHRAAKSKCTMFCLTKEDFDIFCSSMPYNDRCDIASLITEDLAKIGFYYKPASSFNAFYNYSWKPFD